MNSASNLSLTVQQAVAFLTSPLLDTPIPLHAVDKLQRALTSSLTTRFTAAGNWDVNQPEIGSESRAIRLSTACPPPTYVARACEASGVQWAQWLYLLGGGHGLDLDLFVDPGRVSVCFRKHGCSASDLVTVWKLSDVVSTQELLAYDDDSEIFNLINQKVNSPSWVASWSHTGAPQVKVESCMPTNLKVPKMSPVPIARSHLKVHSHSRSSSSSSIFSGSSHSSGGSPSPSSYSVSSDEDSVANWRQPRSSGSSDTSSVTSDKPKTSKPSNRSAAPVVVDASKASVTHHDGGKTRVVGGGTMIGGASSRRR